MNNPNRGTSRVTLNWEDPGSTALVVPVPEAEPLVGRYRRRYTPSGAAGMLAHITLVAPFTPAPLLTAGRLSELRTALGAFGPFEFDLTATARFDARTLYLVPEPGERFIEMAIAVGRDPAKPPGIIPHLTVASSDDSALLDAIEQEVTGDLPLHALAREVLLAERGTDGRWADRVVIELAETLVGR